MQIFLKANKPQAKEIKRFFFFFFFYLHQHKKKERKKKRLITDNSYLNYEKWYI